MVPRNGCWKGVYAEFIKRQLLCTLLPTRCPWITCSAVVEQHFLTSGHSELTFFFPPQILTWKSWIAPTWGLVVAEICQGNKKMLCERAKHFPEEIFIFLFYNFKKKRKLKWGCGLLVSAAWCEDCLVQLWVRRGWCALKSRKLKIASGK